MSQILPFAFQTNIRHRNFEIKYENILELCQGGPETGNLLINGVNHFPGFRFGGPLLIHENFIYTPVLIRNWFTTFFRLARINLDSNSLELIGEKQNLILIEKIQAGQIFYFTNIGNSIIKSISLK